MDQSGQDKQEAELPIAEDVTPAKQFVELEEAEQKALIDKMSDVYEIEDILPNDVHSLSKNTTEMVFQKMLNCCGLLTSTKEKTAAEVQLEQKNINLQLRCLNLKKTVNALMLTNHQLTEQVRKEKLAQIDTHQRSIIILEEVLALNIPNRGEFEQQQQAIRNRIVELQNELDKIEYPLRNDSGLKQQEAVGQDSDDIVPPKKSTGFQDQKALDDVVFVVEGKKFGVSKEKLIKNCDYFEPMLNGPFMESTMTEIPLEKRTAADFELFLRLLDKENCLTEENIFNAVEMAQFYQAKGVMDGCEKWLEADSNINKNEKFQLADHYGLESLRKTILNTIPTVFGIQEILPEKIHDWTKDTLAVVLEKTLEYFGIRENTEPRTVREVEREQNKLQMQIDTLVARKKKLKALATRQRELNAWLRERRRLE